MIVGFKLLIEYANTIPELRVFYILERVKSMLISIKGFLEIFDQKVAMAKSGPSWSIIWINSS